MRRSARICWLIVLGGVLATALGGLLEPQLYPLAAKVNGGCSGGGMGDPCQLLLGVVGFVCLMVPAALAMLVAWILAVILAGRSHHWIWLASLLVPLVIAVPLWVTGSPLAANGLDEAGSALGNELLAIGWLMVGLTILISLVYSLWPHPKRPATAPTTAPSVAPSVHTLKGPKMPPNGPPTAPPT